MDQAIAAQVPEPNAMTLATATPEGIPSARMVLLKGLDGVRVCLPFQLYEPQRPGNSQKCSRCTSIFLGGTQRQVRVEGTASQVTPAESDAH